MSNETFTRDTIEAAAVDKGNGWTFAEVDLAKGETAWNPTSGKGPLHGPVKVVYEIHPSGITVRLHGEGPRLVEGTAQPERAR